ncbi:MAG: protein kinase [Acidobacteria bacterium]|nr:protein kinase [Acidobacteriota bacterium]
MNREMPAAQLLEISVVVAEALELPESDRSAFLDSRLAGQPDLRVEAERLLQRTPLLMDFLESGPHANDLEPLERFGPYRVLRRIGEGGMGIVYLAARDDGQFQREVAIKVIGPFGSRAELLRRFEAERHILAQLEHPNIARLLDAGVAADGAPYLVLEYVQGEPITDWCESQRLTIEERLRLFAGVCSTVHAAHRQLTVHRDIKPANILVTAEGQPKLLDFGIAKLLSPSLDRAQTAFPLAPLTLQYASPEQARGENITTASDIYSLGVLLYELLSSARPYDFARCGLAEAIRIICVQEPQPPSQAAPPQRTAALRGDLDCIVAKTMHKDPEQRYSSAYELATDVGRYLSGEVVTARPPAFAYVAARFLRRNKRAVLAGVCGFVLLLASLAAALWQARIARSERDLAFRRFHDVRALANSIIFEFHDGVEKLAGATHIRQQMVARSLEYLDKLSNDAGEDAGLLVELASAYVRLGDVQGKHTQANLGDPDAARKSYDKAQRILERALAIAPDYRQGRLEYGRLLNTRAGQRKFDRSGSGEFVQKASDFWDSWARLAPLDPDVLHGLAAARFQAVFGKPLEERLYRWEELRRIYEKLLALAPGHPVRMRNLALVHRYMSGDHNQVDRARAREHALQAVELDEARVSADPRDAVAKLDLAFDLSMAATSYRLEGEMHKAILHAARSLELRRSLWQADPQNYQARNALVYALRLLAEYRQLAGDRRASNALYQEAASHGPELLKAPDPQRVLSEMAMIHWGLATTTPDRSVACRFAAQSLAFFRRSTSKAQGNTVRIRKEAEQMAAGCGAQQARRLQ